MQQLSTTNQSLLSLPKVINVIDCKEEKSEEITTNSSVIVKPCLRCGRPLSNQKSLSRGVGPKCFRNLTYELRRKSESASYLFTPRTQKYLKENKSRHNQKEKMVLSRKISSYLDDYQIIDQVKNYNPLYNNKSFTRSVEINCIDSSKAEHDNIVLIL